MTKIGTLAELNVQPGDVVKHEDGSTYEIRMKNGKPALWCIKGECKSDGYGVYVSESRQQYRIISRATQSPKLWRDMTPEEKGSLLLAARDGKVIEGAGPDWRPCRNPQWVDYGSYRVKPEPKVETIEMNGYMKGDSAWFGPMSSKSDTHSITFNLINGKPDCASVKMEHLA